MTISENDILDVLRDMEISGLEVDSLEKGKSLIEQGMDSLDLMDLYFRIEEKFDKKIEFDDDATQHAQWTTVTDITAGLNKL